MACPPSFALSRRRADFRAVRATVVQAEFRKRLYDRGAFQKHLGNWGKSIALIGDTIGLSALGACATRPVGNLDQIPQPATSEAFDRLQYPDLSIGGFHATSRIRYPSRRRCD